MYKVLFNGVVYAEIKTLEEAVSLSLAIHRSSNVTRDVTVADETGNEFLCFHAE